MYTSSIHALYIAGKQRFGTVMFYTHALFSRAKLYMHLYIGKSTNFKGYVQGRGGGGGGGGSEGYKILRNIFSPSD